MMGKILLLDACFVVKRRLKENLECFCDLNDVKIVLLALNLYIVSKENKFSQKIILIQALH